MPITSFPKFCLILFVILGFAVKLYPQNVYDENESSFLQFENKIISQINIRILDIAGQSINEKDNFTPDWVGNLGNSIHLKTRDYVVRNYLLFETGDTIKYNLLEESERLLRSSNLFLDARIKVLNDPGDTSKAIIFAVVQDKWTLAFQLSYSAEKKSGYFGLKDDNFLGLGHSAQATLTHDNDPGVGTGGKFRYSASNIRGTYLDAAALWETNKKTDMKSIGFFRPLVTTEINWIGSIELTWISSLNQYTQGGTGFSIPYKINSQDVWLGRLFPVWFGSNAFQSRSKIVTAARIQRVNYSERPEVTQTQNRIYENRLLYLLGAGFINRRFYKDVFVENFGTTEDIPIGGVISLTTGSEMREFNDRWYLGANAVYSTRLNKIGYLSGSFSIGGFRNIGKWEQNVVSAHLLYHTHLNSLDGWKHRFYIKADYILGYNRFLGEVVYLETETGLRGIDDGLVSGTKRTMLNLESRFYSPYSIFGFSLGGIAFADLGIISDKNENLTSSRLYQGYGLGIRTENESIANTKFQIAFVYNPYTPKFVNGKFSILLSSRIDIGPADFGFGKPSVISFGE